MGCKEKLKFENCKNCFEVTKLEDKIKYVEKKINIDNLKKSRIEFIRNNKSILKIQQRFKREKHNFFTKEINKIDLSSNDNKRMQSNDSIETYAFGMSKGLVSEEEVIKYNNIMKRYKKLLTLMILQK